VRQPSRHRAHHRSSPDGGIRTANRRRSRSWRAQTPSALKPAAASHRTWSSIGLGWSYTPSISVHDTGRIVRHHKVADHKPPARPEPGGDAGEQVRLTCAVEVVHRQRRHDEVEVALGRCILETAHAQSGGGDRERVGCPADCSRTRRPAPAGRWLAAEVEDLLKWRESGLEVDAVDIKAVLTKPAVEGILRGAHAG
jgi:hypothetical protein